MKAPIIMDNKGVYKPETMKDEVGWRDVVEFGRKYGEEIDRSHVEKWLGGKCSSKAVRVLLRLVAERMKSEKSAEKSFPETSYMELRRGLEMEGEYWEMKESGMLVVVTGGYQYYGRRVMGFEMRDGGKLRVIPD